MKQRIAKLEATLSPRPLFVELLAIVHSFEESPSQARKIAKVNQLLSRIKSFIVEGIKICSDLIAKAFEILDNVHKIETRINSFKDILESNLQHNENFFLNHVTIFSLKVQSLTKESSKR